MSKDPNRSRRDRLRRQRLIDEGLCYMCGKRPPAENRKVCKPCGDARNRSTTRYYKSEVGRPKARAHWRRWCKNNPERLREQHYRAYQRLRNQVFSHYGLICACCEESEPAFLTIDHINGGGRKHTDSIKTTLYNWLKRNGFPAGFQTLCWNCNSAKHIYGSCPHKKEMRDAGN
jgi:hypothetical protein